MIISIDGPAGSGKSTVANILAEKLDFIHFNSGSLYRGITAYILKNNVDLKSIDSTEIKLETKFENNTQQVIVNNEYMTNFLRNNDVSISTPQISIIPKIRQIVDECQRSFCSKNNVVIDGRDIGSYVFPDAEYKFYLDCAVEERARRRYLEETKKNPNISLKEIENQLIKRDETDKAKKIAPLCIPKNAIIIDSTSLSINQVVEDMLKYIKEFKKQA
ncbi:MAG: (d)CMP kinase [Clostridia bacterium]|nr:(d)CMP kinase [Clostridia bacterium]